MKGVTVDSLRVIGLAGHSLKSFKAYLESLPYHTELAMWPKLGKRDDLVIIRGADNFLDAWISLKAKGRSVNFVVFDTLPVLTHLGIEVRDMQALDFNRWIKVAPNLKDPPAYTLYSKKMVTRMILPLAKKIHEKRLENG